MTTSTSNLGAVVIGRNEGERLKCCLRSLQTSVEKIVYVDSGSTDGSVQFAQGLGIEVVELDCAKPFTMARGRNAGFQRLDEILPQLEFVQFIDGDCEIDPAWLRTAIAHLTAHPQIGSICGDRRERFPERSLYNRLTDMDWRGIAGEVAFCGGDVLMRRQAFRDTGGYIEHMIAGEDPEICVRLRQCGWKLCRLDIPMTSHDIAMLHFSQLWKRNVRSGHAYAEGAWMHRNTTERPWSREVKSNFFWGLLFPAFIFATAAFFSLYSLVLLSFYPLFAWRIYSGRRRRFGTKRNDASLYALFCMMGKVPCALGQCLYYWRLLTRSTPQLIEYKFTNPQGLKTR